MSRILSVAAVIAAIAVSATDPGAAQSADGFYKGKTITILIGSGVAGGTDAWSRTLARNIGRYIPGNPSVIPMNMPGAAGLKMTNYLYNAAPRDGTVFGNPNGGIVLEPLLGGPGASFDATKLSWIGSPDHDTTVCVARKDAAVQSVEDLRTTELVVGSSGSGGNTHLYPTFFANLLGMKIRVIPGYTGTSDILLAVERGEVAGMCSAFVPLSQQSLYRAGKLRILFQAAATPNRDIDAPAPVSFITSEQQRKAVEFVVAREDVGRPFFAPPDIPGERLLALRRAFDATMKDPGFLADAKKQNFNIVASTGEELSAIMARIYQTPPEVIDLAAKALGYKR
jgi:tripartite-type tricarboxylate transporter receptor subunit TctC